MNLKKTALRLLPAFCFLLLFAVNATAGNDTYNTWICHKDLTAAHHEKSGQAAVPTLLKSCEGLYLIIYPDQKRVVIGSSHSKTPDLPANLGDLPQNPGGKLHASYVQEGNLMLLKNSDLVLELLPDGDLLYYSKNQRESGFIFCRHM